MKRSIFLLTLMVFVAVACKKEKTSDTSYTKIDYTGASFLSEARGGLAAAATGNKIVFAGGYTGTTNTKAVDMYDVSTNTWGVTQLSEARNGLAGAAFGNKIVFVGGYNSIAS